MVQSFVDLLCRGHEVSENKGKHKITGLEPLDRGNLNKVGARQAAKHAGCERAARC